MTVTWKARLIFPTLPRNFIEGVGSPRRRAARPHDQESLFVQPIAQVIKLVLFHPTGQQNVLVQHDVQGCGPELRGVCTFVNQVRDREKLGPGRQRGRSRSRLWRHHQGPTDQGERAGVASLHFLSSVLGFAIGNGLVIQSSDTQSFRRNQKYVRGNTLYRNTLTGWRSGLVLIFCYR
jgi:hypothetical protein